MLQALKDDPLDVWADLFLTRLEESNSHDVGFLTETESPEELDDHDLGRQIYCFKDGIETLKADYGWVRAFREQAKPENDAVCIRHLYIEAEDGGDVAALFTSTLASVSRWTFFFLCSGLDHTGIF